MLVKGAPGVNINATWTVKVAEDDIAFKLAILKNRLLGKRQQVVEKSLLLNRFYPRSFKHVIY